MANLPSIFPEHFMDNNMETSRQTESPGKPELHRACANCAHAKAKCVPDTSSRVKCARCNRLNKSCETNPIQPKSLTRKRKPLESTRKYRVEKLEAKLEDIVLLLKSGQETTSTGLVSPPKSVTRSGGGDRDESLPGVSSSQKTYMDSSDIEKWNDRLFNGGGSFQNRFAIPSDDSSFKFKKMEDLLEYQFGDIDLGTENPDHLLNTFRNEMHPNFPFTAIPDSVSAAELRRYRPTLYTAVMAVTTRNTAQKIKLGQQFVQQIADRVIVRAERNLDLLLGILTYTGWCCLTQYNVTRFASLMSAATSLIGGMTLPCQKDDIISETCVSTSGVGMENERQKIDIESMEARRSVLGHWLLSSLISESFHRLERPTWSAYHDSCCSILQTSNAHRDDITAVNLARIHILTDKIAQSPWHQKLPPSGPTAPPVLYFSLFEAELKALKESLSLESETNISIILGYHSVEVMLYKIGLTKSNTLDRFALQDFNRVEALFACNKALKIFFDMFLSVDVRGYHCWSAQIYTSFTSNLGVLQMMATFDHPGWDPEWAAATVSFPQILELLSARCLTAKAVLGLDPQTAYREDMFSNVSKKLLMLKSAFEARHATNPAIMLQNDQAQNIEVLGVEAAEFAQAGEFNDFMDDHWMQDLFSPWEY